MSDTFKFRYVRNGNATGFLSSKGQVTQNGLQLGKALLSYGSVADSTTRDSRLVLVLDTRAEGIPAEVREKLDGNYLILEVSGNKAESLERYIDRFSSRHEADQDKKRLEAEGKGHLFKAVECPCCQATVNLSELPDTPYSYCRFCETIFGKGLDRLKGISNYRECDECGYHDRVQGYGEFYFYFLLVVYGFSHNRRHMCDACGAALANKLLAINAIFILGVPNAIACMVRARAGKDPQMQGLSAGNRMAKKGRMEQAEPHYEKVLRTFKDHPGIRYNQALGNLRAQNIEEGLKNLKTAVEVCPSYEPAIRLIHRINNA